MRRDESNLTTGKKETGKPDSRVDTTSTHDPWVGRILVLLLAFYLFTALAYGIWFPLGEGPDEPAHFFYADHLARTGRLPVLRLPTEANETLGAHHSPLYYVLSSLLLVFCGEEAPLLDYRPPPPGPRQPVFHHHSDSEFPWSGRTLAWHLVRIFTAFLGLLSLWIIFCTCRMIFEKEWWPVAAVGYLAVNPQFAYLHSRVSNDSLAVVAGSLLLLLVVGTAREVGSLFPYRRTGLVLSLALLSKLNAPFLAAGIVVSLKDRISRSRHLNRRLIQGLIWMVGIPLILCGWWFLRSWQLYGDPTGMAMVRQVLPENYYPEALGLAEFLSILLELIQSSFRSSWPYFGWQGIELPRGVFNIIAFVHLLVWARLLGSLRRRDFSNPVFQSLAISTIIFLSSYLYFNSFTNQSGWSGRYLFPASAVAAAVFVAGWSRFFGGRERLMMATLVAAGLILNAYTYWWVIWPAYLM